MTESRPVVTVRHRVEYAAVMAVRAAARCLPMAAVIAAGTLLGRLFHALDRPHRGWRCATSKRHFPAGRLRNAP